MVEIDKLQAYLNLWKTFSGSSVGDQFASFQNGFLRLKEDYKDYKEKREIVSLKVAPEYNIFKLLGVNRDEVKNTAFLANLLNPDGSHGQGLLFLKSFLEYGIENKPDLPALPSDFNQGRWFVTTEKDIGVGRFDIFITNWDLRYMYVIENKIDASEQNRQLERYGEWMEKYKMECPMQALIFLTISGHEAVSSRGHKIPCFSYHDDIKAWLESIIPSIQAPAVREVVIQYKDTVARL
jgi:hypothetical protein